MFHAFLTRVILGITIIVVGLCPLRRLVIILQIIHPVAEVWSPLFPLCVIGQHLRACFITLAVAYGSN
jgi:hypothetical protein